MADETKYTHIGIEKMTQRKIAILAAISGKKIYELVSDWAETAWQGAKAAGKVTDEMLPVEQGALVVVERQPAGQLVLPE